MRLVVGVPALGLAGLVAAGSRPPVTVERRAVLMGTELVARVVAPDKASGAAAIEAAFRAVARADERLSTWRDDSELGRVNAAAPGTAAPVSAELAGLLAEVARWRAETLGAFDPAIGALVEAWDLRGVGRVPAAAELARARAATGLDLVTLHPNRPAVVRLDERVWLDSGGFGKGAGLREAGRALRAHGVEQALLNFGGQVLALGAPAGSDGWRVTVAHPADRATPAAVLALADCSAATSSQSERFVSVDGARYGHVLDPRSGRPAPPWGSVTVVHRDAMVADILATALFVLGPEAGMGWLEGREEIAALFLIQRGGAVLARWNAAMDQYLDEGRVPGAARG